MNLLGSEKSESRDKRFEVLQVSEFRDSNEDFFRISRLAFRVLTRLIAHFVFTH